MGELANIELEVSDLKRRIYGLENDLVRLHQKVNRPRRPIYIPVTQFSGYHRIVSIDDVTDTDEYLRFSGSGNPVLNEINSLGIVGAHMEATGDSCHHIFYVPKDLNVNTNLKFEVVWLTRNTTTSNTATWRIRYSASKAGEALSAASTALSVPITADNVVGVQDGVAIAPFGLLYGGAFEHGDLVHLDVDLQAVSGLTPSSDLIFLLGILINDEG